MADIGDSRPLAWAGSAHSSGLWLCAGCRRSAPAGEYRL